MNNTTLPPTLHPDNVAAYLAARRAGACQGFLKWLAALPSGGWRGIPLKYAKWALVNIRTFLSPAQIDACAEASPCSALIHAAHLLTPQRLDCCAEERPCTALEYAAHLLTPRSLAVCHDRAANPPKQKPLRRGLLGLLRCLLETGGAFR